MSQALSDLVVIDLSRVLAGPYGTMVLGDFGAQIIKIEQPGRGDDTRQWGPPFTESGQSAYFLCANRNKRSMTLNLKSETGRQILRQLVAQADVLIENFKVGTMATFELDYLALCKINPGLIYCAITGYGQTGPEHNRPGYDTVIQAQGGLMSITGPEDGEPFKVGVAIVDITAGLQAVIAILAALHHRERTGQGQFIDIALFDTQLSWLANVASNYLVSGQPPQRYGNGHSTIVPYQTFQTQDGHLMLAVGNDRQFTDLCRVVGRPQWATDPLYATNPARVEHRDILIAQLGAILRQRPTHEWIDRLLDAEIPCGPVNDIPQALADPQAEARDMVQEIRTDRGETVKVVGPVAKMNETPPKIQSAPPALGEHSAEILGELLGYNEAKIDALRADGVI